MTFHRRRLPHFHEIDQPVFLTWRLHDSLPPDRAFPTETLNSGRAFAAMDRLLDEARAGAVYLRQSAVANMIVVASDYRPEPVSTRYAQIRLTGAHFDSSPASMSRLTRARG